MSRSIITGIDIGTYHVKVVISEAPDPREERSGKKTTKGDRVGSGYEKAPNPNFPKVLGMGMAESKGLRHGYITNVRDVARSIRAAVAEAEKRAGVKVKRAFVSAGGIGAWQSRRDESE